MKREMTRQLFMQFFSIKCYVNRYSSSRAETYEETDRRNQPYVWTLYTNSEENALHLWPQITIRDHTKKDKKGKEKRNR
jgi:hypothetical protein